MRVARGVKIALLGFVPAWAALGFWNSGKPMPPGTHVASAAARVPESDVDFLSDSPERSEVLARELAVIDRAEQIVVIDHSPLAPELAQRLAARQRARANLKIVLVTDPGNEAFGATPAEYLTSLERAGVIVARVRLERLRDSNPLYSGLWRLCFGWWSDPFDEVPGKITLSAWLRMLNHKSDERQLLVADDGSGGWISIIASAAPRSVAAAGVDSPGATPSAAASRAVVPQHVTAQGSAVSTFNTALLIRGSLARDIAVSELQIAEWSTDDDRLPAAPQTGGRGVGSIDARFLSEGAIGTGVLDAVAAARGNDEILVAADRLGERRFIAAALSAAARGVRLRVLLNPHRIPNQAAAGELLRDGSGHIDVRWQPIEPGLSLTKLVVVRHRTDLWVNLGSANFTRRNLDDLNLAAGVEARMPGRTPPARAVVEYFERTWSQGHPYPEFANESTVDYWRYRIAEAWGLSSF